LKARTSKLRKNLAVKSAPIKRRKSSTDRECAGGRVYRQDGIGIKRHGNESAIIRRRYGAVAIAKTTTQIPEDCRALGTSTCVVRP
jgi:hypothetical protein